MRKEKAWVWFKNGKEGGKWMAGFLASSSEEEEGILIEHKDFVSCRVPKWRISLKQPNNEKAGPDVPVNAIWKLN